MLRLGHHLGYTQFQVTIVLPLRWLIKLREQNRTVQVLPQLMRLAETKEAKVLAADLVRRLIGKV
jgi:hypothetical protein